MRIQYNTTIQYNAIKIPLTVKGLDLVTHVEDCMAFSYLKISVSMLLTIPGRF
jgi:hypothetical protein